jgi:uncharacterized protein YjbJ (UPF0337 family)
MNRDTAEGKFDQLKGKAKQSIGEALGNDKLANSGTVDQVKGAAKEAWGNAKDTFHAVTGEAHACCAEKHGEAKQQAADTAHDVREKITSTAQNVKNAVSAKAEAIQREHKHTA